AWAALRPGGLCPPTILPKQAEAIFKHGGHALQAALAHEAGGKLDGQRDPVEAPACLHYDPNVLGRELARPAACRRALEKDLDGCERLDGVRVHVENVGRG